MSPYPIVVKVMTVNQIDYQYESKIGLPPTRKYGISNILTKYAAEKILVRNTNITVFSGDKSKWHLIV